MYANDYNSNGTIDPIICKTIDGNSYPYAFRDDLLKQIPSLKKKFNTYSDYANATIEDIIGEDQSRKSNQGIVETLATSLLLNTQNHSFTITPLNWEAQQSPVYAIEKTDINLDGNDDLLLGGNQIGAMEQIGQNLSNKGTLLIGDGEGTFSTTGKGSSSLGIEGEVRDILQVDDNRYIWLKSQEKPTILKLNKSESK